MRDKEWQDLLDGLEKCNESYKEIIKMNNENMEKLIDALDKLDKKFKAKEPEKNG